MPQTLIKKYGPQNINAACLEKIVPCEVMVLLCFVYYISQRADSGSSDVLPFRACIPGALHVLQHHLRCHSGSDTLVRVYNLLGPVQTAAALIVRLVLLRRASELLLKERQDAMYKMFGAEYEADRHHRKEERL